MPDNIHRTEPPSGVVKPDSLAELFRKYLPAAVFACLIIVGNFVWNASSGQSQLAFKVEADQKAIEQNAANIKANADTMNQFLIALTKLSEAQNRLTQDVERLQQNQQRATDAMNNRK